MVVSLAEWVYRLKPLQRPMDKAPFRIKAWFWLRLAPTYRNHYGSVLVYTEGKGDNIVPYLPERDIYFCGNQVCEESDAGAVPSGWPGPNN